MLKILNNSKNYITQDLSIGFRVNLLPQYIACKYNDVRLILTITVLLLIMVIPEISNAQWAVKTDNQPASGPQIQVAYTTNTEGYTLEIYKDSLTTITSRFILKDGLIMLPENFCPTFQIDNGMSNNKSINGAPCLSNNVWSEYIFGEILNGEVNSPILLALMDGITITFRFKLYEGDYRETKFSLSGSKRSMTSVIGAQIVVRAR